VGWKSEIRASEKGQIGKKAREKRARSLEGDRLPEGKGPPKLQKRDLILEEGHPDTRKNSSKKLRGREVLMEGEKKKLRGKTFREHVHSGLSVKEKMQETGTGRGAGGKGWIKKAEDTSKAK